MKSFSNSNVWRMNSMRENHTWPKWICGMPGCTFPCGPGCFHARWILWTAPSTKQSYGLATLVKRWSIVSRTYCTVRPTSSWGRGSPSPQTMTLLNTSEKCWKLEQSWTSTSEDNPGLCDCKCTSPLVYSWGCRYAEMETTKSSSFYPWYDSFSLMIFEPDFCLSLLRINK